MSELARQVVVAGSDAAQIAAELVERLRAPDLRVAFVAIDGRLDAGAIARAAHRGLAPAIVVGAAARGVIAPGAPPGVPAAAALGLCGDWVEAGAGMAPELAKAALSRGRDAVEQAARAIGTTAAQLDSTRHVGIALVDGRCGYEEAFCIGSAAAAPQIRMVGGCAALEAPEARGPYLWVQGEPLGGGGAVIILDSELPFYAVTSSHLMPTELKAVVTAASGRVIDELDGRPAAVRLRELVARLGEELDPPRPVRHSFARYIGGMPYVRSIVRLDGDRIHLASAVESGHVLRVMRPGDLIGTTRRDLAIAAERVGGTTAAVLAFSCLGRHWEAEVRGLEAELADVYAQHGTIGLQTFGEQSGMLLVNHTLTGLAIGARR